ncbi:sugar transport 5 [Olea europaea subsp. europaea]|uniref:Sugar transport 5 n=1 Tax=Olea europaea subsp. europaea TaxID=158383 RepID=A0A8S0PPA2_OLEEU|nr:sugar transport 5 [Olea europaea subsp. europaea]
MSIFSVNYIIGGVTTRPFLEKFFPSILKNAAGAETNVYCAYDSQILTSFTSSLCIAGLAASLVASRFTAALGHRNIMVLGGRNFFAGVAINGAAENITILILGCILLGFGGTPVYLSKMAPPKWQGAFNTGFQFFIGISVVAANCINYDTASLHLGWHIYFGLAMILAAVMILGASLISDTPSSLVERSKIEQA